jgi:hypothetical protein
LLSSHVVVSFIASLSFYTSISLLVRSKDWWKP